MSLINNQGVGPGEIQPGFHNGRAHQHIKLAVPEPVHGVFQLFFPHLTMGHADTGLRNQLAHKSHRLLHLLYPVVYPEHLSFTGDLAFHNLTQCGGVTVHDRAGHGLAFGRSGFNDGKFTYAGHGKLERTGNGGGRQRQCVHIFLELFELFLVAHAKTLLFVQNKQTEVRQHHILGKKTMRADKNIYLSLFRSTQCFLLARPGHETAQQPHVYGKARQTRPEGLVVLFGEHSGRTQQRCLTAVAGRAECRAQRHFRLAETDIAAHQTIHGHGLFHIGQHLLNGACLIRRLLKPERRLKFPIHLT